MYDLSSQCHHRVGFVPMRWPWKSRWKPTHVHRKGGEYRVLGQGVLETDRSKVTHYDDQEGTIWVRPVQEFEDGRFTPIAPSASGVAQNLGQLFRGFMKPWCNAIRFRDRKSLRRTVNSD